MIHRTEREACPRKKRHHSRAEALTHLARLVKAGAARWRLNAYRCKHCKTWHVGHLPRPGRRR